MKRIQRKRTKGWKMPPNTIYVGRTMLGGGEMRGEMNHYGNWHVVGENGTAQECVEKYKRDILEWRERVGENVFEKWISPLCGHDLACWCSLDNPCHADVLLLLANEVKNEKKSSDDLG
jgi:hypothetical protein